MKATNKRIIAGISLLAAVGIVLYIRRRRQSHEIKALKAEQVSEHGYETAHDILFPRKNKRLRGHRSHHS